MPGMGSAADDEGHVFRTRHELSIRPTHESMGIGKSRFGSMVFASGELNRRAFRRGNHHRVGKFTSGIIPNDVSVTDVGSEKEWPKCVMHPLEFSGIQARSAVNRNAVGALQ